MINVSEEVTATTSPPSSRINEEETMANEMAITAAAGNAAKAARIGLRRTFNTNSTNLRISNTSSEAAEHDKDITATKNADRDTAKVYNGFESDDDEEKNESTSTTLDTMMAIIHPEEQPKSLIAKIGLLLVQTWNWLHYFFVTIIFFNLFNVEKKSIAKESGCKIEVVHNFCGGGSVQDGETETEFFTSDTKTVQESSSSTSPVGNMSPNTCSIQNQEETVEKAEEAIIMAATTTTIDVGNLGDAEQDNISCDKSSTSEENDSNINNTSCNNEEELGKSLEQKIISQVEAMFSNEHLSKDGFLLKHVRRRSDGFVSLKLVAGFRKVKQISRDFPQVLDALRVSTKLEINPEGTKIRRAEPLSAFLTAVPIKTKEKGPGKDKETQRSSIDENQHPPPSINLKNNKTATRNLDNARNGSNQNGNRRNSAQNNANNNCGSQCRRNSSAYNQTHRKSSNTSSNNSSRYNSFSKPPLSSSSHPADLLRNVYSSAVAYSSSGEESLVRRRRGGSLPFAALQRSSGAAYLSPNSSPPGCNGAFTIGPNGARPKSNSYCEGSSPATMCSWLQRRRASASATLPFQTELVYSGVVRQPRGPDGTKGFPSGYRTMIREERLQQQTNSPVST